MHDFNKNFAIRELFNYAKEVRLCLSINCLFVCIVLQRPVNRTKQRPRVPPAKIRSDPIPLHFDECKRACLCLRKQPPSACPAARVPQINLFPSPLFSVNTLEPNTESKILVSALSINPRSCIFCSTDNLPRVSILHSPSMHFLLDCQTINDRK